MACPNDAKGDDELANLDPEDSTRKYLERIFKEKDQENNGKLSVDELWECLAEMGYEFEEEGVEEILKYFDTNGDGKLGINELLDNVGVLAVHSVAGQEILRCFKIFDRRNTGYIRLPVMKAILCSGENGMSPEEAGKLLNYMVKKYDVNKDGRFDYTEFVRMFVGNSQMFEAMTSMVSDVDTEQIKALEQQNFPK